MAKKEIPYKIYLEESEMPRDWYNVRADMVKKPAPLLDPKTGKPITSEELGKVFCDELVKQHTELALEALNAFSDHAAAKELALELTTRMK